jgi:hypothetical protein
MDAPHFRGCPIIKQLFQSGCGVDGTSGANPAWHIAAHHANFWAGTVAKVQLILRRCGSGFGSVAGFAPKPNFQQTFGFKNSKAFQLLAPQQSFPIYYNHYNPCD